MNLKHMMLGFPANALVENHLPMQEMQEMQVLPLGGKIPWRAKWPPTPVFLPDRLQSMGSQSRTQLNSL